MYTVVTVLLLCIVIVCMIWNIYRFSEIEAYEKLHMETTRIKSDIDLQILSDRENLVTMANFAAKLYSDGESFALMFESFEKIGMIENIGILMPDDTFITKIGSVSVKGSLSFAEEAARGAYVTAASRI